MISSDAWLLVRIALFWSDHHAYLLKERRGGVASNHPPLFFLSHGRLLGYAYFMVMMQAFNGAGDTVTPTIVNLFGFWLFEIPLAYVLAMRLGMRSNGVFFSIAIAESSMAVASAILFKQGRWKKQKI